MFQVTNVPHCTRKNGHKAKYIQHKVSTKFLSLQIDNRLKFKSHVNRTIRKLKGTWYTYRSVFCVGHISTHKSIYLAYFHSIVMYGKLLRVIRPTVGRYLLCKELLELWLVQNV
jgi:hypothetical protein